MPLEFGVLLSSFGEKHINFPEEFPKTIFHHPSVHILTTEAYESSKRIFYLTLY